jgi:nicotinamidase/pyrazinamidase
MRRTSLACEFNKEASPTRDDRDANNASQGAARPGPSLRKERLLGRIARLHNAIRLTPQRSGETAMLSRNVVFWEVDTQKDFMLPGGKLYVPGAERLLPNIRSLTDAARQGRVFLVSHGCYHVKDDPEFQTFPPHCIKGTDGSALVTEALTDKVVTVPNEAGAGLPRDLSKYQQVLLEKQTLDIFESRHVGKLLQQFGDDVEFVVFGVVTEYCVRFAAKGLLDRGRRVSLVQDAIETLKAEDGRRTVAELQGLGARLRSTDEALALLEHAK